METQELLRSLKKLQAILRLFKQLGVGIEFMHTVDEDALMEFLDDEAEGWWAVRLDSLEDILGTLERFDWTNPIRTSVILGKITADEKLEDAVCSWLEAKSKDASVVIAETEEIAEALKDVGITFSQLMSLLDMIVGIAHQQNAAPS